MSLKNPQKKHYENVKKVSSLEFLRCNFQKRWFFLELLKSYKIE